MTDFTSILNDDPVCPYCFTPDTEWYESTDGEDGEWWQNTCDRCDRDYVVRNRRSVTFDTRPLEKGEKID